MPKFCLIVTTAAISLAATGHSQIIGSLGNFDTINDTGETAEGFEIDVEDVSPADIPDTFPTRFYATPWVNRFGPPVMDTYDNTATGGHKGTRIIWSASWNGTKWVALYGNYAATGAPSGDGVVYNSSLKGTNGDSCWLLGQGAGYAKSGCEHFGLTITKPYSKIIYHWLVPNPAVTGTLMQSPWSNSVTTPYYPPIAPQPAPVYVPPVAVGQPPVVHDVVEGPEDPNPQDPQWSHARWVKTYTSYSKVPADLNNLQANLIPVKAKKGVPVTITWTLLQRPPAGVVGEKLEVSDDPVNVGKGYVAMLKRYEYYDYTGVTDPSSNEVICDPYKGNGDCLVGPQNYTYTDPETGLVTKVQEKGKFLGAHNDAVNMK